MKLYFALVTLVVVFVKFVFSYDTSGSSISVDRMPTLDVVVAIATLRFDISCTLAMSVSLFNEPSFVMKIFTLC